MESSARIGGLSFLVVGGYPRFQYEGSWISTVDPWPEYWGDNWYDDVYVAYVDNGYDMYNRRHPNTGARFLGALPRWSHSRDWGYYPSGGVGMILLIVVILLVVGRI